MENNTIDGRNAAQTVDLIGHDSRLHSTKGSESDNCCGESVAASCTTECGGAVVVTGETKSVSSNDSTHEVIDMLVSACSPRGTAEDNSTFGEAVKAVKSRMTGAEVNVSTVTILLKYAMEAVELTKVTGAEQKELAVKIVRQIIVDAPLSEAAEATCMAIVDSGVLCDVVDLVVDATKGRLCINKLKKKGKKCLLGCIRG